MNLAIITGASVGIGCATAEAFLASGFEVCNLSRRDCPVDGVRNPGCDLSDEDSLGAACDSLSDAIAASESVCLVHNAAQMLKDSVDQCDSETLRRVLETNVVAINSLNQHLLPVMPRSSSVIYVGSTLSEKAVPGSFSYVVSKHAQLGMMRSTCQDLMGRGIHTALVCPGFTDTEMLRQHIPAEAMESIRAMSAYGRLIDPDEIAETIFWAATNPVINGAVLHANLGQRES